MNSKSLVKKNLIICCVLCLMLVSIFLPVYAQAETEAKVIEKSIFDFSYNGSANKVSCAIQAKGEVITFYDDKIEVKNLQEINIEKIMQSVIIGQTVTLKGKVILYYNENGNGLVEKGYYDVSTSFKYGTRKDTYKRSMFDSTYFKNKGDYYIDIDLKFERGDDWSTSYNKLLRIDNIN